MHSYNTEQEAARGLLVETTSVLVAQEVDYAIVGGWVPFLLNPGKYSHPGTYDVDILLNERTTKDQMAAAAASLRERCFARSPKNRFQLHRLLGVNGELVHFHLDFLHRKYADDVDGMFKRWGDLTSIAGPGTDIIFTESERRQVDVSGVRPDGSATSVLINFATEPGFLSAKGRSLHLPKRTRDAYDIFLVIAQSQDYGRLVSRCNELMANKVFKLSMKAIVHEFGERDAYRNVAAWISEVSKEPPDVNEVEDTMVRFFETIGAG